MVFKEFCKYADKIEGKKYLLVASLFYVHSMGLHGKEAFGKMVIPLEAKSISTVSE